MKLSGLCMAAWLGFALAGQVRAQPKADTPGVDTLKQVLDQHLQKLRPVGTTERNILFQEVRAGKQNPDGSYPFQVNAAVRDYGPGYPANRFYGETCVGPMDKRLFELSRDAFGEWQVSGAMTVTSSDGRQCKPNPAAGVSSIPLASLTGSPAPSGPAAAAADPAAPERNQQSAAKVGAGATPLGQYNCVMSAGGQLIHVGGFTLEAGGVYHDEDNGRGTFTYDSNQHQIAFQGAAMAGQMGGYDSARSTFTLKSARNSVDCDRDN